MADIVSRMMEAQAIAAHDRAPALRSVAQLLGGTPLVELTQLARGLPGRVAVKLETLNPTGSVKGRVAVALIEEAEAAGALRPGGTIVAASSGNTGLALAQLAATRGYRTRLVIPEDWSHERLSLLLYLGASIVRTPGGEMRPAIDRARREANEIGDAALLSQFSSPANPDVHRRTTAEEIWRETGGQIAAFVAGVGTGGTISGVAAGLRAHDPGVKIIAVEPASSPVLSGGKPGRHGIQGIGAGFVPPLYRADLVDRVVKVTDEEAFARTHDLARLEGLLAGVSSGANVAAALALAARPEMRGKLIVTVACDSSERYVSTPEPAKTTRRR